MTTLEGALAYMRENGISATYWAGDPWWGDYNPTIEPQDLSNPVDRLKLDVLARYSAEELNGIIPLLQGRL
jgi:endoglucanase